NLSWPIKFQNTSKVKKNSFFVLNDNRSITLDSRTYGFVEQKNVLGIVQALPFDKNAENINGNKKEFFKK
ncbi:MAG: S26 family signal peptidase, partial [Lactobacillaceae bacterium]|nr:S26 family signal peptidase [Lactobacillaceae bacterium]